jgi:hypothetical protein
MTNPRAVFFQKGAERIIIWTDHKRWTVTDLSPAAASIVKAFDDRYELLGGLAAALRAAADQVLPEADTIDTEEWIGQSAWQQAEQSVRFRFLAIAAELDGTTP